MFIILNEYVTISEGEYHIDGIPAMYIVLASVAITIPLGTTITRFADSQKYGQSVNWFPFYFVLVMCGILAIVPLYVGITESNVSFVAILAAVEIVVFLYVENDWRRKIKGEKPKEKVYKPKTMDLTSIKDLHEIEELKLSGKKLTHIDLSQLTHCQNLKILDLTRNRLKSIDLSPLSHCTNLKTLRLDDNKLTEIDLFPLASLGNFKVLTIQDNKIETTKLESLSYCDILEELYLGWLDMKEIDLSPLSHCNKLKDLRILGDEFKTIDLEPLRKCPDLDYLGFAVAGIEELDLSPLEYCKNLHTIEFNWASPDSMNVTALFSIPGLVKLGGIWPATKLWASFIPEEISEWPITLRDYRGRIELV